MPVDSYTDVVMRMEDGIHLRALPVVEEYSAIVVTTRDELAGGRYLDAHAVATGHVPTEPFFLVHPDGLVLDVEAHDFVVTTLAEDVFPVRVDVCTRDRLHFRIGYMLDDDRNPVLPEEHLFVVTRRRELAVVVHESDGVHGAEMLRVLLRYLSDPQIVLADGLTHVADEERVLLVIVWMELSYEWVCA
jgi:hypothetical protein